MSQLQVSILESNNTITANSLFVGNAEINNVGIVAETYSINTSAISLGNAASNIVLRGTSSFPSINIAGVNYTSFITETVNTQLFTANGTWTKPTWATDGKELVIVHMWGGGGGGITSLTQSGGLRAFGGGGAFVYGYFIANNLSATQSVIVGVGGGSNADFGNVATAAANGGNSSFANLVAYGGGGATISAAGAVFAGGGGGWLGVGSNNATTSGGAPLGGANGVVSTFGGGGAGNTNLLGAGGSVYGGGGGGSGSICVGGNTIYGGGGGGDGTGDAGISVFGGRGGSGPSVSYLAATAPGGGGGGFSSPGAIGDGARGEVRIYTLRIMP